ncbi:MAG: hypothetical protein CMO66_01405 [Verrucomicrobiales bacterium]|nr:hypothetical protein [Verrucomicrobiales bacterium]|tara:strand:- start:391 stop:954 length:564 start_codon:yes stop_codon:yes gene_type:complete
MIDAALQKLREICNRLDIRPTPNVILVSTADQRAAALKNGPNYAPAELFTISTSRFGIGQKQGSRKTPTGLHRIAEKFGDDLPSGAIFKGRKVIGQITPKNPNAEIAHRILWLDGLEDGLNKGGNVDSHDRYIYIHGIGDESTLGQPASQGCIHMAAHDLIPLCDKLPVGSLVLIGQFQLPHRATLD